jgi:plastocyanin
MSPHRLACLGAFALVVAACSAGGSGSSAGAPSAAGPQPSAATCTEETGTGTVTASIMDFKFEPAAITAKAGDLITFTNSGAVGHNATLDSGGCATKTVQPGSSDGLRITVAGTYPFHCTIHPDMKGTITVGA